MGWKGTLRSLSAAQRRSERASRQRHTELVKRHNLFEKMAELEKASYEVEVYENRLEVLSSIHKDCGESLNWGKIKTSEPPTKPENLHHHEEVAQVQLVNFKPGMADKLLKRSESKRDELTTAVTIAQQLDQEEYQEAVAAYEEELAEWDAARDLANRILAGDCGSYLKAIEQIDPFGEVGELGSAIEFQAGETSLIEALLHVNSEEVIPREIKTLLKNGKLSVKEMPKSKFLELYQDYVCGCVLRIAREIFALLPVEITIITAMGKVLNTKTGHLEETPILSVVIPRATLSHLNFDSLDPSDSMNNFVHRMSFKKTAGFSAIKKLTSLELQFKVDPSVKTPKVPFLKCL